MASAPLGPARPSRRRRFPSLHRDPHADRQRILTQDRRRRHPTQRVDSRLQMMPPALRRCSAECTAAPNSAPPRSDSPRESFLLSQRPRQLFLPPTPPSSPFVQPITGKASLPFPLIECSTCLDTVVYGKSAWTRDSHTVSS